jgi:hypothetical protein
MCFREHIAVRYTSDDGEAMVKAKRNAFSIRRTFVPFQQVI